MSKVLIVGGNGTVGSEIAKVLKAKGHDVRVTTSKPAASADQVHLNLLNREGLDKAFNGIKRVFLLSPPGYTNQDELLAPVIDQAKAAGVEKIVLMTAMGANADENSPFRKAEVKLEKSGINYNIIRPNWFMQNFNSYWIANIRNQGRIQLSTGDARGSFIDARDIAAVAAELLASDRHDNQAFDLTGGQAIDHKEVAAILTRTTGKAVSYESISSGQMLEGLLKAGLPRPYAEFMLVILDFFRQGYSERMTDSVEKITGRKPITFEQYAKDYKQAWL